MASGSVAAGAADGEPWDLFLAFGPEHEDKVSIAVDALKATGLKTGMEGKLIVLVRARDDLLEIEAEHRGLDVVPGQPLLHNQRLDMARSLLDHVPLPTADVAADGKGKIVTIHSWLADEVCELVQCHDRAVCLELWKRTLVAPQAPVDRMREYFGEHVTFYFAWVNFFTRWLVVPGLLGLAMWLYRPEGITVRDSPLVPFFSLFIVVWGVLFVRFWQREASAWACKWQTLDWEKREVPNPDFFGEKRISPVTGQEELYYPAWKRSLKYLFSAAVTGVMLCVAFGVMVCSLNLQGYIRTRESLLHVPGLFRHSQPGQLFDPEGSVFMSFVPVIGHSIVILILNQHIYSRIALALTKWENHKHESEFENALILKRFLFEAFDAYIALFYLAFYECSVTMLRVELVGLYMTDAVRRVVTESLLPLLLQWLSSLCVARKEGKKLVPWTAREQLARDEYEQFDDYLELVVQQGYITLFASAFPLCAALSFFCNLIEIRSDIFKLAFVTRRPPATRAANIGTWQSLITVQVFLSIATNCLLFALASNQMAEYFPWWFHDMGDGRDLMREGAGRKVVGLAWGIEHAVVALALFVWFAVDSKPEWVRVEMAKAEYEANTAKRLAFVSKRKKLLRSVLLRGASASNLDDGQSDDSAPRRSSRLRKRSARKSRNKDE